MNELALFAGAGGGVFSVDTYLAGIRSAQWNLKNIRETSSSNANETASSPPFPSGMMSAPLTAPHGEDLSTSSVAASPAKISAQQEKAQASTAPAQASGNKCTASFAKYAPDTHSWRTPQCSLNGGLEPFSETWPKQGIMLHGVCWEQTIVARHTSAKESGFLQETFLTPTATEGLRSCFPLLSSIKHYLKHPNSNLTEQIAYRIIFPTPTCRVLDGGSHAREALKKAVQADADGMLGGHLNPEWVEWLMAWPIRWTDLKPLETAKFLSWQQQHSSSLTIS